MVLFDKPRNRYGVRGLMVKMKQKINGPTFRFVFLRRLRIYDFHKGLSL